MPVVQITNYALQWNPNSKKGRVTIRVQGATQFRDVPVASAEEFAALAAILNESPVFLNTDNGDISTQGEEVGGT